MNRRLVTAGIMIGLFLSAMEGTVVGTAMPTVISQLGGVKLYSLVFAGYMLTSTVSLPLWGKLSDSLGRRPLYVLGTLIFVGGSALCGLARSMPELIAYRAIQGIGAGAVMPIGFTIVGEIYTLEERARMQAVLSSVWGVASIIGPLLGGFITDNISWRGVFLIPVPTGLLAAAIVGFAYRGTERPARRPLDWTGATLLTAAASALMVAAGLASRAGGHAEPLTLALAGAAVVLGVAFVAVERTAADPIVHLELFRLRIFAATSASGLLAGMAMFGVLTFTPLLVQGVIGTAATEAGATLTPFMLGWVVSSSIAARVALRRGYRLVAVAGTASLATGAALLSTLGLDARFATVVVAMGLCGLGLGASFTPLLIAVQSAVPRTRMGAATSAVQFFRSIGGAVGVAALGAILGATLAASALPPGVGQEELVDPIARARLDPGTLAALREGLAAALHRVFAVNALFALGALGLSLLIPGGAAHEHVAKETLAPAVPALDADGAAL